MAYIEKRREQVPGTQAAPMLGSAPAAGTPAGAPAPAGQPQQAPQEAGGFAGIKAFLDSGRAQGQQMADRAKQQFGTDVSRLQAGQSDWASRAAAANQSWADDVERRRREWAADVERQRQEAERLSIINDAGPTRRHEYQGLSEEQKRKVDPKYYAEIDRINGLTFDPGQQPALTPYAPDLAGIQNAQAKLGGSGSLLPTGASPFDAALVQRADPNIRGELSGQYSGVLKALQAQPQVAATPQPTPTTGADESKARKRRIVGMNGGAAGGF